MSQYTRAFDLVAELKADIDYEFRNKVQVFTDPTVLDYEVKPNQILVNPELIHNPERLFYKLILARKELRIYSRLGHGNLWIGSIICWLRISLLWFPIFFAYFWYSYQKEMAKEIVRATVILYGKVQTKDLSKQLREAVQNTFINKLYWLWPEDVDQWLARVHYEVLLEEGIN